MSWEPLGEVGEFRPPSDVRSAIHNASLHRHIGCFLYETSVTSIGASTWTTLTFEGEDSDTNAFHVEGDTRITIPLGLGGFYLIHGLVGIVGTGSSKEVMCRVLKNGGVLVHGTRVKQAELAFVTVSPPAVLLAPTDYLQLQAFQTDVGAQNTHIGSNLEGSWFGVTYQGPSN